MIGYYTDSALPAPGRVIMAEAALDRTGFTSGILARVGNLLPWQKKQTAESSAGDADSGDGNDAVSYTHLTLPTICSV